MLERNKLSVAVGTAVGALARVAATGHRRPWRAGVAAVAGGSSLVFAAVAGLDLPRTVGVADFGSLKRKAMYIGKVQRAVGGRLGARIIGSFSTQLLAMSTTILSGSASMRKS